LLNDKLHCLPKSGASEMKVRQLSGFLFLAILVLFVSSIVVQAEGCEFADRLVEADLFKEALDNYTTLLTENSTSICAKSGIGNATNGSILRLLKLGESYNLSNQTNEARIAYNEALKKDPNNDTAINALKNIAIVVPDTGINVYIENINNFLYYILYFFALIFGLYLICIALKLKIYPWWKEIDKPRLDIQDFDKGATELDIGKGLTSMVEESIIRNTKGSPWWSIDQVQSSIKSLDIPADIKSISSYFKFLVDLIEWIFPSNVIRVEGSLEKPGDQGAGLTLTMVETRTGKIKASQTIWQKDYDPMMTADAKEKNPVPYYNLAESAAIWTIFEFYANTKVEKELLNKNHNICCKLILRNKYGISYCYYCISYKLNLYKCKIFDFINKKLIFYLFNWEEIPGNDNGRLIDFLKSTFDLDWVKEAEIKKSEDKSTIIVDTKSKSLSLMLNDDKTKVNIKIDDGRTDELIARTENCNLNIYIRSIWKYICCISRCDFHDASTFRLLNTSDWKSYACFRAGVRLFEDEKFDKALIMFLNALEYDPKNAGALYNAGVLFMVEGEYYKALEYFDCLITITKNKPDLVFFEYASTYQIAATYLYIELKKEKYKKKIENILLKVTGIDEIIKVKEICESIKCAIDNYEKSKQKLKSAKEDWNNLKNNMIKINYSELICDLYSLIPLLD
jgi:tetratricopeptide (TPR) repeat protein